MITKNPSSTVSPEGLAQEVLVIEDVCLRQSPHDQLLSVKQPMPLREASQYTYSAVETLVLTYTETCWLGDAYPDQLGHNPLVS